MAPPPSAALGVRHCPACRAIYRAEFARCPIDGDVLVVGDDPLVGATIAQHYVIDAFLGEGAMARVYRAHHALLAHKQFAVKVMIGDLAATLEMRLRFAQEADAASQLDHPNVVSVVDFGRSESGLLYIVMELVDGRTLHELIAEEGALAPGRAIALARQICLGLAHAHERGLVHRDLKPENIIVTGRPEQLRIVDFGLAIPTDDDRSTRLTAHGLAMGTPIYAAPEQTQGLPVDHRADLFALGVTLYEMLAGVPPFDGVLVDIVRGNASDRLPPIAERSGRAVPAALEDVVRRLMRRDPADRPPSALAVIDALEAAQLAPAHAVALSQAMPEAALDEPVRRRGRTLLGIAALAGIAGALAYAALPADEAAPIASTAAITAAPIAARAIEAPAAPAPPPIAAAAIAPPTPPAREAPPPTPAPKLAAPARAPARTVAPAQRAASGPRPPRVAATRTAKPPKARGVRDEEFYGGPTGFSQLPEPVTPSGDALEPVAPEPPIAASVRVAALRVDASLVDGEVRRALADQLPRLRPCYAKAARAADARPATSLTVTLAIDEERRTTNIKAGGSDLPGLATCVVDVLATLHVDTAPATAATISVELAFQPAAP